MPITVWYVILGVSIALLVSVGVAMFLRVRRLARASQTQFRRAVQDDEIAGEEGVMARIPNDPDKVVQ